MKERFKDMIHAWSFRFTYPGCEAACCVASARAGERDSTLRRLASEYPGIRMIEAQPYKSVVYECI